MGFNPLFGAVVDVVTLLILMARGSMAYYDRHSEEMLVRMESKLDIIINEMGKSSDHSAQVNENNKNPITLLTVDKTSVSEMTEVQVHYIHNVDNVHHQVRVAGYVVESTEEAVDGDNFLLSISCNSSSSDCENIMVNFANADRSDGVQLVIDASRDQAPHQDLFRVPVLQIPLSGDLLYYIGGDAHIKVTASSGHEDPSRGFTRLQTKLQGTYLKTDRFQYLTELVTVEEDKQFIGTKESTVKIETSDEPLSGFLGLSVTYSDSPPALVRQFTVERSVIVRPTNQTGPFPDGFVSFSNEHTSTEEEIERVELCKVGTNCTITCVAVGESITELKVTEKRDMEWALVSDTTISDEPYHKIVSWTVEAMPDTPDTRYKCEAENHDHGTSARQDVRVRMSTDDITFVPERSGIERLDNGTVILHCVVRGRAILSAHWMLYHPSRYVWMDNPQGEVHPVEGDPMESEIIGRVREDDLIEGIQIICLVYKFEEANQLYQRSHDFFVPLTEVGNRNDTTLATL